MATVDLQNAYCSVPIHPEDRKHVGLCLDFGDGPCYLTDNFLCFGSKCSAFIFNGLTDAVSRYMRSQGYFCYNYLDDFIIIGNDFESTRSAQLFLIKTLRLFSFYISWKKVTIPSLYCRYLGMDIDPLTQRLLLPEEKILKLHHKLSFWKNKKTATKLQMQRLCGVLNFCCKVVRGGRVKMFHIIQLLSSFNTQRRINLPVEFLAENFKGCADFFDPIKNTVLPYRSCCFMPK